MRRKLAALAATVALAVGTLLVSHAAAYEAGYSVYVDTASRDGVFMQQSYINEWVGVAPGHWNMDYGNPYNPQSVNRVYIQPGQCMRVYNVNAARNGWVYKVTFRGWDNAPAHWIELSPRYWLFGWNRVSLRQFHGVIINSLGQSSISLNECDHE